jgi:5S rRNA maturation endonuclease (ribonuclease M5)
MSALFPPKKQGQNKEEKVDVKVGEKRKEDLTLVATYDYHDENGELLFQKLRYINEDGKKRFFQRKPDPESKNGWNYKLGDTPKVLYNLPAVLEAVKNGRDIIVVEGEKDADNLIALGYVATSPPNGAGKWLPIHTEALKGARVDIFADNDEPGWDHAFMVQKELEKAGCDVAVFICPDSKDISDHLGKGGKIEDLELLEDKQETPEVNKDVDNTVKNEPESFEVGNYQQIANQLKDLIDTDVTPQQLILKTSQLLTRLTTDRPMDMGRLVDWNDFIAEADNDNYDWLIDGLLEKGERVMVVAAEGVGKTMLARQVALCTAGGMHPFTYNRIRPIRTLTVDLENPERIIRRTTRSIHAYVRHMNFSRTIDAHLLIKPAGLNLMEKSDRLILEKAIEEVKPEMLIMGPLYKAFIDPGVRTSESIAVEVAKYLDEIRAIYGVALWLEHHAPLGSSMTTRDLRPFGSAVWSRWPEFGISLTPDPTVMGEYVYDVKHFRGARDERQWPTKMKRGKRLPFEVIEFMKVTK